MAFTIPTLSEWPVYIREGVVSLAPVQAGTSRPSGPSALIVADKWVRAHALRTICGSGMYRDVNSTGFVLILSMLGVISDYAEDLEMIWDHKETSGTTAIQVNITYRSTGLTDSNTIVAASGTRVVTKHPLSLPNYVAGPVTVLVYVKNTASNGDHYGITLQETSLTSI